MIQRIQTLWLFLAALVNVGLFYFCLYSITTTVNATETTTCIRVNDRYVLMLLALVTIALPLATIFLFKHRKRQRSMVFIAILANISFISSMLMKAGNLNDKATAPTTWAYHPGAVMPVVAIVFLIMAMRGIRKDEKLVKSLERLR